MSDAREVVQPRWKRRATEIAEAIGGSSSSDVDKQTFREAMFGSSAADPSFDIIQAFKQALYGTSTEQLAAGYQYVHSMMEVLERAHPLSHNAGGGHQVIHHLGPLAGKLNIMPTYQHGASAVQHVGILGAVPGAGTNYNDIPISTLNPLNVQGTVNIGSFPHDSTNAPVPLKVHVDQLPRYTNGNTKPVPIMSGSNLAGAVQELRVREQNLTGTPGNGIKTTETAPVTSVSVSGTVGVNNHPAPVTTVSVDNHPTPVTTVSVDNHPTPVTTVSVDNHPTTTTITGSVAVQPALDANNVAIPLSVTETNPVSGGGGGTTTGVQQVKIVGDETYGIIMTKTYRDPNVSSTVSYPYSSFGFGKGVSAWQTKVQNAASPNWARSSDGWTIRVNGVDIFNQDISLDLRNAMSGTIGLGSPNYNTATLQSSFPYQIPVDSQATVDKYHGRKVTLSTRANVWIVEPFAEKVRHTGYVTGVSDPPNNHLWTITLDDGNVMHEQSIWNNNTSPDGTNTSTRGNYYGARVVLYEGSQTDNHSHNDQLWIVVGIDDA